MSNDPNPRTGVAAERDAKANGDKAATAKGPQTVANRGAQLRQNLAVQSRDGEWLLQISLSLAPSVPFGGPGDGPRTIDPPAGNAAALAAAGTAVVKKGKAPADGPRTIDPPGSQNLTMPVVHAPIELRGANITVRFATHAAKLVGKRKKGPGDGPGTIDPPENEN